MLGPCDSSYLPELEASQASSQVCRSCGCLNPYRTRAVRLTYRSCLRCNKELRSPVELFGSTSVPKPVRSKSVGDRSLLYLVAGRVERYDNPAQFVDITEPLQRVIQGRGGDSLEIGLTVDVIAMAGSDPALGIGKVLRLSMFVRNKLMENVLRISGTHLERPFTFSAATDSIDHAEGTASETAGFARRLEMLPAGGDPGAWAPSAGTLASVQTSTSTAGADGRQGGPVPASGGPLAVADRHTADARAKGSDAHIHVLAATIGDPVRSDRCADVTSVVQERIDLRGGRELELSATNDLSQWLPNPCRGQRMRLAIRYMAWGVDAEAVRDCVPCRQQPVPDPASAALARATPPTGFRLEAGLRVQVPGAPPALRVHSAVWGHVYEAASQVDVALRLRSLVFECEPVVWAVAGQPRAQPAGTRRRIRRRRALLRQFRALARTAGREAEAARLGRVLAENAAAGPADAGRHYCQGFDRVGRRVEEGTGSEWSSDDSSDDDYDGQQTPYTATTGVEPPLAAAEAEEAPDPKSAAAGATVDAPEHLPAEETASAVRVASAAEAEQAKLLAFEKPQRVPLEAPGGAGPAVPLDGRDMLLALVPPPRPGDPHPIPPVPKIPPSQPEFRHASEGRWLCVRRGWDACDLLGDPAPGQPKVLRLAWEMQPREHAAHAKERNGRLLQALEIGGPVVAPRVVVQRAVWSHSSGAGAPVDVTLRLRRRSDQLGGARAVILPQENVYQLLGLDRHGKPARQRRVAPASSGRSTADSGRADAADSPVPRTAAAAISGYQPSALDSADGGGSDGAAPKSSEQECSAAASSGAVLATPATAAGRSERRLPRGAAARLGLGAGGMKELRTVDPFGAEGAVTRRMTAKGGAGGAATGYMHALDVELLLDGVRASHRRLVDMMESTLAASGARAKRQARATGQPLLEGAGGDGIMVDAGELTGPGGQPAVRIDRAVWGHPLDSSQRADIRSRLQSALQRTRDGMRLDWPQGTPIDDLLGDPCPGTWRELHARWTSEHMEGTLLVPGIRSGVPLGVDIRLGWPPEDERRDGARRAASCLRSMRRLLGHT